MPISSYINWGEVDFSTILSLVARGIVLGSGSPAPCGRLNAIQRELLVKRIKD